MARTTLRLIWIAALAAVIVGSLMPARSSMMQMIGAAGVNDKVEHFSAYALLACIPALDRFGWRRPAWSAAFVLLVGATLELLQLLVPGRSCDWHDMVANSCGVVMGLAMARMLQRITGWSIA